MLRAERLVNEVEPPHPTTVQAVEDGQQDVGGHFWSSINSAGEYAVEREGFEPWA